MSQFHPPALPARQRFCWLVLLVCVMSLCGCKFAAQSKNTEGVRLYQAGQYMAALQKFQDARVTSPKDSDSYYNMAATYHQLAKQQGNQEYYQQAETLYNQCLDLSKDHVECHRALAVMLVETGRQDAAFRLLQNWTTNNPQSADARVELARLYQEFGDPQTAQVQLQSALQLDQNNARAWAALGSLREAEGNLAQAMDNYRRSLSLNGQQPAVASRVAALNQSVGGTGATWPGDTRTADPALPKMQY